MATTPKIAPEPRMLCNGKLLDAEEGRTFDHTRTSMTIARPRA